MESINLHDFMQIRDKLYKHRGNFISFANSIYEKDDKAKIDDLLKELNTVIKQCDDIFDSL